MNQLLTLGYARWTLDEVEKAVRDHDATLADIRLMPFSHKPGFAKSALAGRLGERYVHLPDLGNVNYKGGPIQLRDEGAGLAELREHLAHRNVILLCGCADVQTCHRRTVAELAAEQFGVRVVHLDPPVDQKHETSTA